MTYETPDVVDYGTLQEITEATGLFGAEDGASKLIPMHHVPTPVSPPVAP